MRPTVLVACDSADDDGSAQAFARIVASALGATMALVNVRTSESLTGTEPDIGSVPVRSRPNVRVLRAPSPAAGLQRLIAAERPLLTVLGSAHDATHGRV